MKPLTMIERLYFHGLVFLILAVEVWRLLCPRRKQARQ